MIVIRCVDNIDDRKEDTPKQKWQEWKIDKETSYHEAAQFIVGTGNIHNMNMIRYYKKSNASEGEFVLRHPEHDGTVNSPHSSMLKNDKGPNPDHVTRSRQCKCSKNKRFQVISNSCNLSETSSAMKQNSERNTAFIFSDTDASTSNHKHTDLICFQSKILEECYIPQLFLVINWYQEAVNTWGATIKIVRYCVA